jgi:hypothetical protein
MQRDVPWRRSARLGEHGRERHLRPRPRIDVHDWPVKQTKKRVAVVRVEPVAEPPCLTSDAILWERVSGATLPVTDAADVRALYERGAAAVERAQASAERALRVTGVRYSGMGTGALNSSPYERVPLLRLAVALAPVGTARDIASKLFTDILETKLKRIVDELPAEPLFHERQARQAATRAEPRQDSVVAIGGGEHNHQTWEFRAAWDGSAVVLLNADPPGDEQVITADVVFNDAVRPIADAVVEVVAAIGGHGRAHLALAVDLSDFLLRHDGKTKGIPSALCMLPIQRWTEDVAIDETLLASMKHELVRAWGIAAY